MAIDFSQVKSIVISEGTVKSIQINGTTVWEDIPVLSSITITGQTTSLSRGASFSFGGTVTAIYSNGSTANVTSASTFSGYNMTTAGTYTVTVSYTENGVTKTTTYQLTVTKAWTTIWSGTKAIEFKTWDSVASPVYPTAVAITNPNLTGNQTFRVTWAETTNTDSASSPWTKAYYNNGTATTTKPGNIQFTINTSNDNLRRIGMGRKNGTSEYKYLVLDYRPYSSSTRPGFQLYYYSKSPSGKVKLKMTVTKIERYY